MPGQKNPYFCGLLSINLSWFFLLVDVLVQDVWYGRNGTKSWLGEKSLDQMDGIPYAVFGHSRCGNNNSVPSRRLVPMIIGKLCCWAYAQQPSPH